MIFGTPPIVTNGLVLYLDPSNTLSTTAGSTTVNDLSVNKLSNTWSGGAPVLERSSFNVTSSLQRLNVTSLANTAFPQQSGSVSIWVNNIYGIEQSVGGRGYFDTFDSSRNHLFIRSVNNTNQIALQPSGGGTYVTVHTINNPLPNTWYNYVVTYGVSKNTVVYVNGALVANVARAAASASWVPDGQVCAYGTLANTTMSGSYGPLMVYNRDITQAEVLQNYNAIKTKYGLT